MRDFALFGETTGETDEFGLPVRYNWAAEYRGRASVVYGHTPVPEPEWLNRTINIDTGCVFGGRLTALRWPEKELVSVPARAPTRIRLARSCRPAATGLSAQQASARPSGAHQTRNRIDVNSSIEPPAPHGVWSTTVGTATSVRRDSEFVGLAGGLAEEREVSDLRRARPCISCSCRHEPRRARRRVDELLNGGAELGRLLVQFRERPNRDRVRR